MIGPTVIAYSNSFITKYSAAFTELLRLGTLASQNKISGKDCENEDTRANNLLTILRALNSPDLSKKEIEALEYCLISLNGTLAIPTVKTILPQSIVPGRYVMSADTGLFMLTGQDATLVASINTIKNYTMSADVGLFVLTGMDATLTAVIPNRLVLTADAGMFTLSGQDASLVYVPSMLNLESFIQNESFGLQRFVSTFNNGTTTVDIALIGNGSIGASGSNIIKYNLSANVTVKKTTNGGIAQDTGEITFLKNGVLEPGTGPIGSGNGRQQFSAGDNLGTGSIQYNFTALNSSDTIKSVINEG